MTARPSRLVIGTRGSALARWQSDWVIARLKEIWPGLEFEVSPFTTTGDRLLNKPLPEIGGKGVFTEELEIALRAGEIDLAVHSLKDLPIEPAPGLTIGAICPREDARDVLISHAGWTLATLPTRARVGTSSLRRSAQLLARRPDIELVSLRGNVDTRVRKAMQGEYDAIVLAAAGVRRLGMTDKVSEYLGFDVMLPAPGQGALAVQCRADDAGTLSLLKPLDDPSTRASVAAEREFLRALGGGCAAPVAALGEFHPDADVSFVVELPGRMTGLVASADGKSLIRVSGAGTDPVALGAELAAQALKRGAAELLSPPTEVSGEAA